MVTLIWIAIGDWKLSLREKSIKNLEDIVHVSWLTQWQIKSENYRN